MKHLESAADNGYGFRPGMRVNVVTLFLKVVMWKKGGA